MKTISGDKVIYKFTPNMEHIESISPNEVIKVETNDCFFQQIQREDQIMKGIDHDRLNPATGPIYVEGAEPGDILQVKILDINVADKGVSAVVVGEGALGDKVGKSTIRVFDIEDGYAIFEGVKIPIDPMIGVIGVASAEEDGEWATNSP